MGNHLESWESPLREDEMLREASGQVEGSVEGVRSVRLRR